MHPLVSNYCCTISFVHLGRQLWLLYSKNLEATFGIQLLLICLFQSFHISVIMRYMAFGLSLFPLRMLMFFKNIFSGINNHSNIVTFAIMISCYVIYLFTLVHYIHYNLCIPYYFIFLIDSYNVCLWIAFVHCSFM